MRTALMVSGICLAASLATDSAHGGRSEKPHHASSPAHSVARATHAVNLSLLTAQLEKDLKSTTSKEAKIAAAQRVRTRIAELFNEGVKRESGRFDVTILKSYFDLLPVGPLDPRIDPRDPRGMPPGPTPSPDQYLSAQACAYSGHLIILNVVGQQRVDELIPQIQPEQDEVKETEELVRRACAETKRVPEAAETLTVLSLLCNNSSLRCNR